MSILNNSLLLGADAGGAAGYQISRSLRFNSSDSAYLSRNFSSSASDLKKQTFSFWTKRVPGSGANNFVFIGHNGSAAYETQISFSGDSLQFGFGGLSPSQCVANGFFRDPSAWYHFLVSVDTTQATDTNRVKIYINGVQQTLFSASYPVQNATSQFALNSGTQRIGSYTSNQYFYNGYLADIHFIDGQALTPSNFGEFSATTGVWVPKAYSGTYGTNGFRLNFADNSSNTATTLGKDTSPNGNNWTPNNLSVTAGAGNDSFVDVPVNGSEVDTGLGGEVRGNYCTLNPLNTFTSSIALSNGDLQYSQSVAGGLTVATVGVSSGKWYWEHVMTGSYCVIGAYQSGSVQTMSYLGASGVSFGFQNSGSNVQSGVSAPTGTLLSFTTTDVIGFALNMDAGTCTTYKNGVAMQTYSGLAGTWFPAQGANAAAAGIFNFGQRPFAYTAPSGFKALCTANLPAPTIVKPSTVMDVKLYTGNGSTQSITGLGFSPDLLWFKSRSGAYAHVLFDSVRGRASGLTSNATQAEIISPAGNDLASFDSSGFTVGPDDKWFSPNLIGASIVAWAWDAGSTTVTNTAGSISSQVRANPSAGFSICQFTSAVGTFGHGLGVKPGMVVIKRLLTGGWITYHSSVGATKFMYLDTTDVAQLGSGAFNNTEPTSSVVSLGSFYTSANQFIAYCFAPVAGYSSFDSYTGNGSADGPFVYLGFRPAFVLVKMSSSTGNWTMLDAKREGYNVDNDPLFPNLANAEGTTDLIDITSNGFKVRTTDATFNTNTGTYVYAAFAEHPFQYARAR